MSLTPADQVAYDQLISSVADKMPEAVCGKPGIEQLPQLAPADIALLCRISPADILEQLVDDIDLPAMSAQVEAQDFAALGARMALLLERACRSAIAYDVMCELEEREIERDREQELHRRVPESLDARYGVAHLFRETTR